MTWYDSGCSPKPRARWAGSRIEIEDEGFPETPLGGAVLKWDVLLRNTAATVGVPETLLVGMLATESNGNQFAGSHAGAIGLMQLLPSTASHVAGRNVSADELMNNPQLNLELGARYLKYQLNRYEGNFVKAAAAYNAGGAYCSGKCVNRWGLRADCNPDGSPGGVDYPTRVIKYTNAAATSGRFGPLAPSQAGQRWGLLGLGAAAAGAAYLWWTNR